MNEDKLLLPWHTNKTLSDSERNSMDAWIQRDPTAKEDLQSIQQLSQVISSQETLTPSPQVKSLILDQFRKEPIRSKNELHLWIWAGTATLLIFILLLFILQPGAQLQWSINGIAPAIFRIYRAPGDNRQFKLIEELPAIPNQKAYHYSDFLIVPGRNYQYILEVRDQTGNTTRGLAAINNSPMILASYFAILLTSFMFTFGIITIAQDIKSASQSNFVRSSKIF